MKVFLTSTLHNDFNLSFNPKLTAALEDKGIIVHMPQRDTDQKVLKEKRVDKIYRQLKKLMYQLLFWKIFQLIWQQKLDTQ